MQVFSHLEPQVINVFNFGVMGFCEGGATLNYALGLKEDKALDGALESVKLFIHIAPWETPLAGKYFSFLKSILTLSLFGKN